MAHDVFISYAHKDKPVADAVCATLESRGVRCWIAPRDVLPGEEYASALVAAVRDSRLLVLVFSADANASPQVLREVERAVSKGLPILPFRIEDVAPSAAMEYYISSRHWLDALTTPLERHLVHLADTVTLLLARDGRAAEAPAAPSPEMPAVLQVPKAEPTPGPAAPAPAPVAAPAAAPPEPAVAAAPRDHVRAGVLLPALVLAAAAAVGLGREAGFRELFGLSDKAIRLLISVHSISLIIGLLVGARWLRTMAPRKVGMIAAVALAAGLMLPLVIRAAGSAGQVAFVLALMGAVGGLGAGLAWMTALATVLPSLRGRAGLAGALAVAAFLSCVILQRLIVEVLGIGPGNLASLLAAVAAFVAAYFLRTVAHEAPATGVRGLPWQWALLGLVFLLSAWTSTMTGSLWWGKVGAVATMVGTLAWGATSDRLGRRVTLAIAIGIQALLLFYLARVPFGSFMAGLVAFVTAAPFALMPALAFDEAGTAFGPRYAALFAAWQVGSWIVSFTPGGGISPMSGSFVPGITLLMAAGLVLLALPARRLAR